MKAPTATRTSTLRLVPSQFTERIQATNPPLDYWGEPASPIYRAADLYERRRWVRAVVAVVGLSPFAACLWILADAFAGWWAQ